MKKRSRLAQPDILRATVLFVCIGVSLYIGASLWFGWKETLTALSSIGFPTLLIGAVLSCSSYLWRFGRWEYSLHRLEEVALPRYRHLAIYLSGLALTATPGKFGETFRSALLMQYGVRGSNSLAAFLVDRASDVLGVCLLGTLAAWIVGQHFAWIWLLAYLLMLLGSCIFAYLSLQPIFGLGWNWLSRFPRWVPIKEGRTVVEAWAEIWKPSRVMVFSAVAMFAYGTQALVFAWFCHRAQTGVSAADCVLIFVQATLFGAATMLPGGLGAMETALVLQLSARGVNYGVAVSLAISIRLVTLWVGMLLGALSLLWSSRQPPSAGD